MFYFECNATAKERIKHNFDRVLGSHSIAICIYPKDRRSYVKKKLRCLQLSTSDMIFEDLRMFASFLVHY